MCDLPWCQQNFGGKVDGGNASGTQYPFGGHRISTVPDETLRSWLTKELRTTWTKEQVEMCVANKKGGTEDFPTLLNTMRIVRWHFREEMLVTAQLQCQQSMLSKKWLGAECTQYSESSVMILGEPPPSDT